MSKGLQLVLLVLASLVLGTACKDAREAPRQKFLDSQTKWHAAAWKQELPDAKRAFMLRTFDCVWDAVSAEGQEPVGDFDCLSQQLRAFAPCLTEPAEKRLTCAEGQRVGCSLSPAFTAAAKKCALRVNPLRETQARARTAGQGD